MIERARKRLSKRAKSGVVRLGGFLGGFVEGRHARHSRERLKASGPHPERAGGRAGSRPHRNDKANPARWRGHLDHLLPRRQRAHTRSPPGFALCGPARLDARAEMELMLSDAPDQVGLELLNGTAPAHSGTTVLWTKVDRLMKDYQAPDGASAKKALQKRVDALREHIAATYQRFLDPQDSRARNVTIRLDGTPVAPWDPFQKGLSELLCRIR